MKRPPIHQPWQPFFSCPLFPPSSYPLTGPNKILWNLFVRPYYVWVRWAYLGLALSHLEPALIQNCVCSFANKILCIICNWIWNVLWSWNNKHYLTQRKLDFLQRLFLASSLDNCCEGDEKTSNSSTLTAFFQLPTRLSQFLLDGEENFKRVC